MAQFFCSNCLKDTTGGLCAECKAKTQEQLDEDFFRQTGRMPRIWDGNKWVDSKLWKSEQGKELTEGSTDKTAKKQTSSEQKKKASGLKPNKKSRNVQGSV